MGARSFLLKVDRAREHFNRLLRESDDWVHTEPYSIIDEPDPEPPLEQLPPGFTHRRFRINHWSSVPDAFPLTIGDCLFNLRSSLDHLALFLARKFTPGLSDKYAQLSEFPIYSTAKGFNDKKGQKIGRMDPAAQAIIESLQPYQGGNAVSTHPLWQLHELNRIDKHRTLSILASASIINGRRGVAVDEFRNKNIWNMKYVVVTGTDLEMNAVLLRWAGIPKDLRFDMSMHPKPFVEIIFDKGGPADGEPVIPLLQRLCDFVGSTVVPKLAKFL